MKSFIEEARRAFELMQNCRPILKKIGRELQVKAEAFSGIPKGNTLKMVVFIKKQFSKKNIDLLKEAINIFPQLADMLSGLRELQELQPLSIKNYRTILSMLCKSFNQRILIGSRACLT
jgi:hypothetical protein